MRVAFFGGTFNPPHLGHLICAEAARVQLGLDQVVFIPVGQPTHRQLNADPGAQVRLQLVEATTCNNPAFVVSDIEAANPRLSYTADTVRDLVDVFPADEHFWIVGGDQAAAFPNWDRPDEILRFVTLAVAERDQWRQADLAERLAILDPDRQRFVFFTMPHLQVSSTAIREACAAGAPPRYLLADPVRQLINKHHWYRD
jgi:nicotinate-nucleotide adenylyltransferase